MSKPSKPHSEEEVFEVMKEYSKKKGYSFTDTQLRFLAESCYLLYESKSWYGVKYWPPLAMKWVLNERGKFGKGIVSFKKPKPHSKSVRDVLLEQENDKHRI